MASGRLTNKIIVAGTDVDDPIPLHLEAQTGIYVNAFSTVTLSLNGLTFHSIAPTNLLKINAGVTPHGSDGTLVDAYLLMKDPNGNVSYLQLGGGATTTPTPMVSAWPMAKWPASTAEGRVWVSHFTGSELPGLYTVYGYLTLAGTTNVISNTQTVMFFFAP